MTAAYAKHLTSRRVTPQSQPIPGRKDMKKNNAGGFSFQADDWTRLDRFLILGSENGSYYVGEKELTIQNAQCVQRCCNADIKRTVDRIVEVSDQGLAPKNDAAVFALAICASNAGAIATNYALQQLSKVCRIGTHLFQFVGACDKMRGWGRGLRNAVSGWYLNRDAKSLAYQVAKYQQRNGWSHRDVLRLCHANPATLGSEDHAKILNWVVKGWPSVGEVPHEREALQIIWAFERAKRADTAEVVRLIRDYSLPRECVPTEKLNDTKVWDALLTDMPLTAMVRNLGKMTSLGMLTPRSEDTKFVCMQITNELALKKSRIHPMALLIAQKVYEQGRGDKGSLTWQPVAKVVDALDSAFYQAFGNVQPTGLSRLAAIDASGSMTAQINGCGNLSCREAAMALALVSVNADDAEVMGFTTEGHSRAIPVSKKQRLTDAMATLNRTILAGGTDCAQPFIWAAKNRRSYDAIELLTDSETWAGRIHPQQALAQYRSSYGRTKLAVVSMVANADTVGDPTDADVLQVVGFDASAPQVVNAFFSW